MPIYRTGDLVRPRSADPSEENPDAIGLILEMRTMTHTNPEVKILWNDMPGQELRWMWLSDVEPLEETR